MANLVVVLYDDQYRAKEVMKELKTLKENKALEIDDAAFVTKDNEAHFHVHQEHSLTKSGVVAGGLGGLAAGLLFTIPIAGLAVGAAAGAIAGKKSDIGIDNKVIKAINDDMRLNTSAIFLLVRDVNREAVVPIFTKYGGKVVQTTELIATNVMGDVCMASPRSRGVSSISAPSRTVVAVAAAK